MSCLYVGKKSLKNGVSGVSGFFTTSMAIGREPARDRWSSSLATGRIARLARLGVGAERLAEEIPAVVRKYKLPGFNLERFADDLKGFLADWPKLKVRGAIL